MKRKKYIRVFEYDKFHYAPSGSFRKHHFEAMVKFNEKNNNQYFTVIHKGVQFNHYVGVIQIGGLTIEVLPKVDKNVQADKYIWQQVLLNMLKRCRNIQVDTVSETQLKKRYNSILDAYFDLYLKEVSQLLQRGLIKNYRRVQNNQTALKGKICFAQNVQKNLIHKERFYCEHPVYDKNHLLNQILLKGLLILKPFIDNRQRDQLNRQLLLFEDIAEIPIHRHHFDRIVFHRKNNDYRKAIEIARILILNYSPSLQSGQEKMLTLLFDMNKLWEEYIFRILFRYKDRNYRVSAQRAKRFWENKRIRPDIVLQTARETFIIDTKWKVVASNNPSDSDIKQMFTYNLYWNTEKSLLLYPKVNQPDSSFGTFHYNALGKKCKLGFIALIDDNGIRKEDEIAAEIIEKL